MRGAVFTAFIFMTLHLENARKSLLAFRYAPQGHFLFSNSKTHKKIMSLGPSRCARLFRGISEGREGGEIIDD
jgi:hypothetical protein